MNDDGTKPMTENEAIAVLAAHYPRPAPADRRSSVRKAVDRERALIARMHADGASRAEIAAALYECGVTTEQGRQISVSWLSTLIARCRILEGKPDPAGPSTG